MKLKQISVIGLGYIGLPTAAVLAKNGYSVSGVDLDEHIVSTINDGKIHIVEPDLDKLVSSVVSSGHLKAYSEVQPSDVYMICVPTPFHIGNAIPEPNIDFVLEATQAIIPLLKIGDMVILESTSPVGTTEKVGNLINEAGFSKDDIKIAYCPERVLPGKIVTELIENDRVIGGISPLSSKSVAKFYRTFVSGNVIESDSKTAEMCKLVENSFRDVNIAFANELSILCDKEGINVWNLIKLANRHPRVNILQPGTGVGGHCIAVDPWFIVSKDRENSKLIKMARKINNNKTDWVINKITSKANELAEVLNRKPTIICLGVSFKADIDDLRESPALGVVNSLLDKNFHVEVVEPNIEKHPNFKLVKLEEVLDNADLFVILVKHRQFNEQLIQKKLMEKNVMDFCGALI